MQSFRQFLEERGGVFTSEDITFLAQYGLQCLISNSVAGLGEDEHVSSPSQPTEQTSNTTAGSGNKVQANPAGPLADIRPEHLKGYRISQVPVLALGEQIPDYAIQGLYLMAQSMSGRVDCRIAVINPWVGEEVVALLQGFRRNTPAIHCIGLFDGNANPVSMDMVDEYGPRTVMAVFDNNIAAAQAQAVVRKIAADPVQLAGELDNQDIHLLVIPPSQYGVEFDAWLQHCRNDAVICGWGDQGVLSNKLRAIGVNIKPGDFWSIQASTVLNAMAKANAALSQAGGLSQ